MNLSLPVIIGCAELMSYCVLHGYSHSSFPSTVRPTARCAETTRICRSPANVTSIGEVYDCLSSSAVQTTLPVNLSYAATDLPFDPPGSTTTLSSTTRGAADIPHEIFCAPLSCRMFFDQIF